MLSPKLSRLFSALIAAALLGFAGCGGGDDEASSPLDEALGYLPEDAGFAFVASTDVDDYDDVQKLLEKFPFGNRALDALEQSLSKEDLDFEDDIKPLLGNELVIGIADNASLVSSSEDTPAIVAIETRDGDKLKDLIEKDARSQGESEGYDLYQDDNGWLALKDDVVVQADDEDDLKAALEQRGDDDRLTEDDLEASFEGLPEDAPVRGHVNLEALLHADPDTKDALRIKWVDHLETLGFTADATEDEVSVEYAVHTDPDGLSDEDLPIASGSETPRLLERDGGSEFVLSLRDPSQVVEFAMAAGKVVNPAGYAQFQAGKEAIGHRLGVDLEDDVLAQLTGDAAAAVTIDGKFGVRAELKNAGAFEKTLAKVMDGLPDLADGVRVTGPKGGLYGVTTEDGQTYTLGVAGDSLVVANDPGMATDVAGRRLVPAEGQAGAFVASADAEKLANEALAQFTGGLQALGGSLFTGPLGELTSAAEASTDGITGTLKLGID